MNQQKGKTKTNLDKSEKPNIISSLPSINWKQFKEKTKAMPVERKNGASQKPPTVKTSKETTQQVRSYNKRKKMRSEGQTDRINNVGTIHGSASNPDKDSCKKLTKVLAMDCEMVGVEDSKKNMLARVSIVNRFGNCVYDKYVKPTEPVVDYRTWVSGVRPHNLVNGEDFETVKQEVSDILRGRIVVGHALRNDFNALTLRHPKGHMRDTSKFDAFRKLLSNSRTPALRTLSKSILGVCIQEGEHSSIQDAKTALQLYLTYKNEWEEKMAADKRRKKTSNIHN